ncbi:MAG: exopolysaccharide biosynthesis polyprenyl glycosylphosphotransferase [bacterium]
MSGINKKESVFLFFGDILIFVAALWLALTFRYWDIPTGKVFIVNLEPFAWVFLFWIISFYIAGLYEKHTTLFTRRLPESIGYALFLATLFSSFFFYIWPISDLTPKTILVLTLVIVFGLTYIWRLFGHRLFWFKSSDNALLVGQGPEMLQLKEEIDNNPRYGLKFVSFIDLNRMDQIDFQKEILERVYSEGVEVVVADLRNDKVEKVLPHLYNLIFSKIRFVDFSKVYEDVFDCVPIGFLRDGWLIENISTQTSYVYLAWKRITDFTLALILLPILAVLIVLVWLAKKFEDNRPIFIFQERVGQNGKLIKFIKFRTWLYDDAGDEEAKKNNHPTPIGNFMRKTRIDEVPQIWNVLVGDASFIGPRPEIPVLVRKYDAEIPYYNIRHLIKPGLSGWAQIYQENPPKRDVNFDDTKTKLSYDLYYVKNRSILLDIKITLRTIKTLLSRSGK